MCVVVCVWCVLCCCCFSLCRVCACVVVAFRVYVVVMFASVGFVR